MVGLHTMAGVVPPARQVVGAGIGLRAPHVREVMATRPAIPWLEIHAENYFVDASGCEKLEVIRRDYPVAVHGVGLSLGGAAALDRHHLDRLRSLLDRFQFELVSEHLAWCGFGGHFLNDLLPIPYTEEALDRVCAHVDQAQESLGRRLLIENPSSYLGFSVSTIPEPEFLAALFRRTGCGMLLDVNNVHVSATNLGFDALAYLDALPIDAVGEIHLAGFTEDEVDGDRVLIDTHSARVSPDVWTLYERALARFGAQPTLIEWDSDLPSLDVLRAEAAIAGRLLNEIPRRTHVDAA
jgi:uncharacterized protein